MQKRFCTCGHMVMVDYFSQKGCWKMKVVTSLPMSKAELSKKNLCPNCGTPLNIHALL